MFYMAIVSWLFEMRFSTKSLLTALICLDGNRELLYWVFESFEDIAA